MQEVLNHRGSGILEDRESGAAYFLMYRRYDESKNKLPFLPEHLPTHVKVHIKIHILSNIH